MSYGNDGLVEVEVEVEGLAEAIASIRGDLLGTLAAGADAEI